MSETRSQKVITILEAHVSEEKWDALQQAYGSLRGENRLRPAQSLLTQSTESPTLWRIISVWGNMGSLQEVRRSGETPAGVLVFRAAGAEPTLGIHEVKEEL